MFCTFTQASFQTHEGQKTWKTCRVIVISHHRYQHASSSTSSVLHSNLCIRQQNLGKKHITSSQWLKLPKSNLRPNSVSPQKSQSACISQQCRPRFGWSNKPIHQKHAVPPFDVDRKRRRNAPTSPAHRAYERSAGTPNYEREGREDRFRPLASFFFHSEEVLMKWFRSNTWHSWLCIILKYIKPLAKHSESNQGLESWIWTTTPIFQRRSSSRCARKNHDEKIAFFGDVV